MFRLVSLQILRDYLVFCPLGFYTLVMIKTGKVIVVFHLKRYPCLLRLRQIEDSRELNTTTLRQSRVLRSHFSFITRLFINSYCPSYLYFPSHSVLFFHLLLLFRSLRLFGSMIYKKSCYKKIYCLLP